MELTENQVQQVKSYVTKNFNYIDLQMEVIDHIISDIETRMSNQISFEKALKLSTLKWKQFFEKDYLLFYFGSMYSAPRIVLKKAKATYKLYYFWFLAIYFIGILGLTRLKKINYSFNAEFIETITLVLKIVLAIAIINFNYILFKVWFSKVKTAYSFIIKSHTFMNIFLIIPFIGNGFFNDDSGFMNIKIVFMFVGIYFSGIDVIFYKKHLQAIKTNLQWN